MQQKLMATLFDYNYTEHKRVRDLCVMKLTEEQFTHDTGYSWGSIQRELVHTLNGEDGWFSRIMGEGRSNYYDYDMTRDEIYEIWQPLEKRIRTFVDELNEEKMNAIVAFTDGRSGDVELTAGQILMHIINHGTIHRAEIMAIAHQIGAPTFDLSLKQYYFDYE